MSDIPYPVEIVIGGTPLSLQASPATKLRWMGRIADAAKSRLEEVTDFYIYDDRPVAVTILYFPEARMEGDIDNIVKPILDGLRTVIYPDDDVVERVVAQRFDPDIFGSLSVGSAQLAIALEVPRPVIYIRVEDHLLWREDP